MARETGPRGPKFRRKPTGVDKDSKINAKSIFSIRNVVLASLVAALGIGVFVAKNQSEKERSTQTSVVRGVSDAEYLAKTDVIIGKIEAGYLNFGRALKPKLASMSNNYLRDLIANTFNIVERNESNADKNYVRFRQHFPRAAEDITILDKDFAHFFYYVLSPKYMKEQHSNARFQGPIRVMQLRSDMDMENTIDRLTAMHELVHTEQDDEIRRSKKTKKEYYDQETVFGLDSTSRESYARACEVEAANAYLDGMLEKAFKNRPISEIPTDVDNLANEIMQKLNAREDQKGNIIGLIKLSIVYYINGGAQEEHLPQMFVKFVHDFLR